jgi:hypothetical protein
MSAVRMLFFILFSLQKDMILITFCILKVEISMPERGKDLLVFMRFQSIILPVQGLKPCSYRPLTAFAQPRHNFYNPFSEDTQPSVQFFKH